MCSRAPDNPGKLAVGAPQKLIARHMATPARGDDEGGHALAVSPSTDARSLLIPPEHATSRATSRLNKPTLPPHYLIQVRSGT
jgi:hypothetical protein